MSAGRARRPKRSGGSSDGSSRGGSDVHVGKRTRTGGLARERGDHPGPGKPPDERARLEIAAGRGAIDELRDQWLPDARAATDERDFQRSRESATEVKGTLQRAEAAAKKARTALSEVSDPATQATLVQEVDALDATIDALRPEVDEVIRLAAPEAASMPWEAAWDVDVFASWEEAEAQQELDWNDALDAEEEARWASATPAPLRDDQCAVDGPHAPYALSGIEVYLNVKDKLSGLATAALDYRSVGPGEAGPYRLYGHTDEGKLVYYLARHQERHQIEWVIGPESIDTFAESVELYAGAAAQLLPGSADVEGSQADGAGEVRDPESVVKAEAFGRAPWQVATDYLTDPDNLNGGGGALIASRNARIRMNDYVKPAKELAEQLADDVASGKVNHLDARAQAVEGRNALLDGSRERLSPAGRKLSERIKKQGKTLEEMTERKVRAGLAAYRESAATRAILDADSELWGKYVAALDAGEDALGAALRDLGDSPEVSRSIIRSAGSPNKWFTRAARFGGPALGALGVIGAADMIWDIYNDVEARHWHAAAGELAGFVGGMVGGELGVIFLASIVPGAGTGVVIIASVIGSMIGSALGSYGGRGMIDLLADGAALGAGGLATSYSAAGGFAGIHSKDHPAGQGAADKLADAIYSADGELVKLAAAIPQAQDRAELERLQKMRLDVLSRRQQMEDLLTAIRIGVFDGPEECAPPPPPPPEPEPVDVCSNVDDDCDTEVD